MARIQNVYDVLVVTASDTVDLVRPAQGSVAQDNTNPNSPSATNPPKAQVNCAEGLSVAVSGNVNVIDWLGNTQLLALVAGFFYPIRVKRVKSTSTTATGICAYFPIYE